jgi:hypothetical protein
MSAKSGSASHCTRHALIKILCYCQAGPALQRSSQYTGVLKACYAQLT